MYTSSEISQIKQVIRENWYAKNNTEPSIYLISTLVFIFILLFLINNTNNPAFLGIFLLFLVLCIMRIFMIFHDLTHRSFSRAMKDEQEKMVSIFMLQNASSSCVPMMQICGNLFIWNIIEFMAI